jgi:periplasmic copper chaperone A
MHQVKELLRNLTFIGILTAMLLTACSSEEGIQVHNPWMMPGVQGNNAAVYFRLYNHTSEGDLLTGVSSEAAEAVELDESMINSHLVEMQQVDHVLLPATTEVKFRSGALQVMLLGLRQDLKLDDEIEIILHFLHYPDLTVKVPVQNFPPPDSEEHH